MERCWEVISPVDVTQKADIACRRYESEADVELRLI